MTKIVSSRTVHTPGPNFGPPLYIDVTPIPPGTPVELEEAESDALQAAGVAKLWQPPVGAEELAQ
jgi:hypothetical protein